MPSKTTKRTYMQKKKKKKEEEEEEKRTRNLYIFQVGHIIDSKEVLFNFKVSLAK